MPRQFRFPWRTPSQVERDVDDELEFHLAMRAEELERGGLSPAEARREAVHSFGDLKATRRELSESGRRGEQQVQWRTMLEDLWRDVRYGARSLARSPGFTLVAIVVLAAGIGANSATFNLVNVLLMRNTLVQDPEKVVAVFAQRADTPGSWSGFSHPEYTDLRDSARRFSDLAAFTLDQVGVAGEGVTRRVRADFVSANYFRTLGVPVWQGRDFTAAEESTGGDVPVAVVNHDFWVRNGRDPGLLGSVLQINGESVAVVGIAADGFTGHNPIPPELWLPLGSVERFGRRSPAGARAELDDRAARLLPTLIGRIGAESSRTDVETELDALAARFGAQTETADGVRNRYVATELPRYSIGNAPDSPDETAFIGVLGGLFTGMSSVVLLIACINLANMFLARGARRQSELAIRQALGSGRFRLVRQLMIEGMLLALAGGAAGLLVAYWAVRWLISSVPPIVAIGALPLETFSVRPGLFVLAATFVSCVVAALLFGLGPAWRITRDAGGALREGSQRVVPVSRRARALLAPRNLLIVAQVAMSLALLTAGGLFLRGTVEAGRTTPGFELEPIVLAELDPSLLGYDETRSREVFRQALERTRALPGVDSASLASLVPFGTTSRDGEVFAAGGDADGINAHYYVVTDDYFLTLGLPLLRGRGFTPAETSSDGGNSVAIVDEPFAERLFGSAEDAVGRFIETRSPLPNVAPVTMEIVGIAPGTRHQMQERAPSPHLYLPFGQLTFAERFSTSMHLQVRVADTIDATAMLEPLRNELMAVDGALPVLSLKTMIEHRDGSLFMWAVRTAGRIFSVLGALALFLAVVGAYGVKAFLVTRRTREIGVRMALGATASAVMRQMLRESIGLTVAGLLVGSVLALGAARLVSRFLFGVSPLDPVVLTGAAALLAASLLLAAYLPTRRATRIDPSTALRQE
jgi:predicted permease